MRTKILEAIKRFDWRHFMDVRNVGLYLFVLLTFTVAWSGAKTIQTNYQLQKKIARLEQESKVRELEVQNLELRNKYLETDQFLELAARRQFGKAAEGERVYNVPKEVALSFAGGVEPESQAAVQTDDKKSGWQQNLQDWRDFLAGRARPDN